MLAFNKATIERAMGAEMNLHLGYQPGQPKPPGQVNERNGASSKTVITDRGPVRTDIWHELRPIVEPAAALPLALLRSGQIAIAHGEHVGRVLCGSNTDPAKYHIAVVA